MSSDFLEYAQERELAFLLVDAGRKLNDACDIEMKPLSLTRSQWRVIAYISRSPGISQTELAARVECSRMAITSLLRRMQSKDLIERHGSATDRRIRTVHLTAKGRSLVKRMNKIAIGVLETLFTGISRKELQSMQQALERIKLNAATVTQIDSK